MGNENVFIRVIGAASRNENVEFSEKQTSWGGALPSSGYTRLAYLGYPGGGGR